MFSIVAVIIANRPNPSPKVSTVVSIVSAAVLGLGVGLSTDQVLKPYITENAFARVSYPLVPNFQFFWVLDALADERVIPWSFIGSAGIYLVLYSAAFVALAAALFETREVG